MSKKNLILIIISFLVILIWITYSVVTNIFGDNQQENDYGASKYLSPVDTNMYEATLQKINSASGNIKISKSSLEPSVTPSS